MVSEQRLRENQRLGACLDELESATWLRERCERLEEGRLWAEYLLDSTKLAATRLGLEEAEMANARPVFIIGAPQSGGEILSWALGQHPNLLPLEETGWLTKFASDLRITYVLGKQGAQLPRMGIKESEFYEIFAAAINKVVMRHGRYDSSFVRDVDERTPLLRYRSPDDPKARWVDWSPQYSERVLELLKLFPNAAFIHLLRDVREAAAALIRLDRAASSSRTAEVAFEDWLEHTQACVAAERAFGSQTVLRLRYAELISDPERALRRCLAQLGEPFTRDCIEPVEYLAAETVTPLSASDVDELSKSPVVAEAIAFNDELLSEPDPEWDPDIEIQVELGAQEDIDLVSLPVEGPMVQRGPATGYSSDQWVDGALTALFFAEEDIEKVTILGDLPRTREGEQATLYLTVNENEFRKTFPMGQQISWTVPCNLRQEEHADLRLRSSRTVRLIEEGIGTDERDLVLALYRLTFSPQEADGRPDGPA